jgi:iron complex transport system substrate-binding protein
MLHFRLLFSAAFVVVAVPVVAQETFTYSYDGYAAELPVDPQRVFVMDSRTGLDFAVSAGFPIVASDWEPDEEMHFDAAVPADADRLEFRGEPNAELVLTYDPDLLVVGEGWWNYWKENNSFNANGLPVLVVKDGSGDDWKEVMTGQLTAYNRADRAAELLAQYDAAVAGQAGNRAGAAWPQGGHHRHLGRSVRVAERHLQHSGRARSGY